MKYIYTRVSTKKQSLKTQVDLTSIYSEAELIEEKISGAVSFDDRPMFDALNAKLRSGDSVIVYDLSRLGRNTQHLLALVDDWKSRGVNLVVHNLGGDVVDTSSATGYMLFTILAAVGQMQKDLQNEKIQLGVDKAKAEGKMKGGVPHKVKQTEKAYRLVTENGLSKQDAAKAAGIGVATLYRYIKSMSII
ncbi:recombinase family protein [Vibrio europaeus]|uniref:recombinase family protein n=1 Tax=Vibrio europaeus TaxID=300876 RepID=UPI0018A780D5|nr:recombinase family protein [Vibrio europaeus]MDC5812839.1 recombinase family protein [Vibrio europaeus]QPG37633.1 recombinase family protein [Vibrio europaeus]